MEFVHCHLHSAFSWDCASKIEKIVKHLKSINSTACAITDHGSMSGVIKFQKECQKAGIKPLLGVEGYICANQKSATEKGATNRKLNHIVLLAKNKIGYENLLKLVYLSNKPEYYYYKPRFSEDILFANSEGIIALNGHFDTSLFDCLIFNMDAAQTCETVEEARDYLFPNYEEKLLEVATRYKNVFGDDFYIECQLFDKSDVVQQLTASTLYEFAKKFGFQATGTGDPHYITTNDSKAHKTFVAIKQNTKVKRLADIGYFNSGKYCIFDTKEAQGCYPEDLILATQEIANKIEEYEITGPQRIPSFTPSKKESLKLVTNAVYKRLGEIGKGDNQEYIDRVKYELEMTEKGELQDYFLIMKDIIDWAKNRGILVGPSRGSVGGALIAYLLKITAIDSIKYDLMWDRFMGPDRIENKVLPDIDTDFQTSRRHEVIEYIRSKYGEDKVCGVVTFGLLQGKSAIKAVFSAWEVLDHKQQKDISDKIPSRDKISDKLADFKEETGSDSIILYTLTHDPDALASYVTLLDGKLEGELAPYFELAIELEGAIKTESRHASAIIVSDRPIYEVAPMMKDKSEDNLLCAFDMYSFELAGLVKVDALGLKSLDGLAQVNSLLKDYDLKKLEKL